jgi:hypothetical protein
MPRLIGRGPLKLLERRKNRPALRVSQHHDEPRAEAGRRKLDASHLRRGDDISRNADDEQVAKALVEHNLGRHAGVRASENDGERLLPRRKLMAGSAGGLGAVPKVGDETAIAFAQPCEGFDRGYQRGLGVQQAIG